MSFTLFELAAADPQVRFSPYVWRTKFCLLHKGLAFTGVPWRFTDKAALAPSGQDRVPVLIDHGHDDRWISDSWRIALYLDETYPERPPLFPDARARAGGRLAAAWAETAVHAAAFPLLLGHLFPRLADEDKAYFRASREQRFGKSLEQLAITPEAGVAGLAKALAPAEAALAVAPFLDGDEPGFADYALAGSLMWVWITAPVPPLDPATAVGRWFETMLDLHGGAGRKARTMR